MKRSGSDYWPLYHDDFWDDPEVLALSEREQLAYLFLLGLQWKHGSLPASEDAIALMCRRFRGWPKLWQTLAKFFPSCTDGTRSNKRLAFEAEEIESKRANENSRKARWRTKKQGLSTSPSRGTETRGHDARRGEEKRGEEKRGEASASARGKRAPSGRVQEFVAEWQEAYREHEGREYVMHAGDGPGVAAFEKRAKSVTVSEFRSTACALLECADLPNVDPFWVTNRNLRTLCSRWSDVAGIRVQTEARKRAKDPPKSFAQESFEHLIGTSPTLNPQGYEDAARSIALPPRQPPGTLASGVARNALAPGQLRALPREAESIPDEQHRERG